MQLDHAAFDEVAVFSLGASDDNRGSKATIYPPRHPVFDRAGFAVVQDIVYRPRRGAFYGIHFQNHPKGQRKLVTILNGSGTDYIVDLRRGSKTYARWMRVELRSDGVNAVFVPQGFGHAFLCGSDDLIMSFKIDERFDPAFSRSVSWLDPDIGLGIRVDAALLSDQDRAAPLLRDSDCNL